MTLFAGVKLSVATPVVMMMPGESASWETDASIEDLARIAIAADRLGYYHMTCGEHVALPVGELDRRGSRYWDPLATFGYLAACTTRIKFATWVLVLGYHHPLSIAKSYGTLDKVSGGRVILGVGVGSLEEEFKLLGADFANRGAKGDDAVRALRASLSKPMPEYSGSHYSFRNMVVDPCAVQDRVPIWVGGRTLRSLRRACLLADGWCPFGISLVTAKDWLSRVETPSPFEVVLRAARLLDAIADPGRVEDALVEAVESGATIISCRFPHNSVSEYLEKLEALADLFQRLVQS
jgi:probable F420-dependent oxidoreductase